LPATDARHLGRELQIAQHPDTAIVEHLPCPGQFHPPRRAQQQLHPQILLQRLHLRAQRRLGDVHPHGGTAEVQFLGNGHEVGKLADFHSLLQLQCQRGAD